MQEKIQSNQDQTQANPVQKKQKAPKKKTEQERSYSSSIGNQSIAPSGLPNGYTPYSSPQSKQGVIQSKQGKQAPIKAKQRPVVRQQPMPIKAKHQPVDRSGINDLEQGQSNNVSQEVGAIPNEVKIAVWKFADFQMPKAPFKIEGSFTVLKSKHMKGDIGPISRSTGGITMVEANTAKKEKAFAKYSSKLLDLNVLKPVELIDGLKFSISAGIGEFKTSVARAKELKAEKDTKGKGVSNSSKKEKGVLGMGFDFDLFSLSIKVDGEITKSNFAKNPLLAVFNNVPAIREFLAMSDAVKKASGIKMVIRGEAKVVVQLDKMPTIDRRIFKKQQKAFKRLQAVGTDPKVQKLSKEISALEQNIELIKKSKAYHADLNTNKSLKQYEKEIKKIKNQLKHYDNVTTPKQVKSSQQIAKAQSKGGKAGHKALQDIPKKKYYQANKVHLKPGSVDRKHLEAMIASKEKAMQSIKREIAASHKLPGLADTDTKQLNKELKALSKKLAQKKKELAPYQKLMLDQSAEIKRLAAEYQSGVGRLIGKKTMTTLARLISHLNILMDTIDGLAFLCAIIMAPKRTSTIFSSQNTVSAYELMTLVFTGTSEGDKEKSAYGTTDPHKAAKSEATKASKHKPVAKTRQEATGDTVVGKDKTTPNKPQDKHGNGNRKAIMKLILSNPHAIALWRAMIAEAILKGTHEVLLTGFTMQHALALVRIAQKYGDDLDLGKVATEYSEATKKTTKGTMDEYLEKLEGACARTLDPSIKKGKADAPAVDRENQHVVHDKELEKEKGMLKGDAQETRSIPTNTKKGKMVGKYVIKDIMGEYTYKVGTTLILSFTGTYNGIPARFDNVMVTVVSSPKSTENGKGKYVVVKYAKNQTIPLKNGKHHVYFSAKADEFNVRIN
jgi:hypothetical protein